MTSQSKTAVVLFNLGGPDRPETVRPFLFNLFSDPGIRRLPGVARLPLAYLMARRRAKAAAEIHEEMGGGSPLLAYTEAQARALAAELSDLGEVRVVIAMRHWHPMSDEAAYQVQEFDPDRVVLLPLYPHYSTATTASSVRAWQRAAAAIGLVKPTALVCCYPTEPGFVAATAALVRAAYGEAAAHGRPRLLFSAHGLPGKAEATGDPYRWQCEQSAAAVVAALGIADLDWLITYQSVMGAGEGIGPSTDAEIERAGRDGVPVVISPFGFVADHAGTLIDINITYRRLAGDKGVPYFVRVPVAGTAPSFIAGLGRLVRQALDGDCRVRSQQDGRICPGACKACPNLEGADRGSL